jgi:uroporphyrinogen-III synthase
VNETATTHEPIRAARWWRDEGEFVGLSWHLVDKLHAAGYKTADDLRRAGAQKILEADGIGKVALEEIKTWLCALDERAEP